MILQTFFFVFLSSEIVHLAFSDVTKKNYEEFFNLLKVCKVKLTICYF